MCEAANRKNRKRQLDLVGDLVPDHQKKNRDYRK
jgi:hypothetical protein